MRILVTGGCGFIGSNLVNLLLERKMQVVVLDDLSTGKREYINESKVQLIVGSVWDSEAVAKAVKDVDAVVHLAALTSVTESNNSDKVLDYWSVNVGGTLKLLDKSMAAGVRKLVLASSCAVHGDSLNEQTLSNYAETKKTAESLCLGRAMVNYLPVILRFANVYGENSNHKTSVIAEWMRAAVEKKSIAIYGDGTQTRDFVHVTDICRAIWSAINYQGKPLTVAVGTGRPTSINDLLVTIQQVTGHKFDVYRMEARPGEIKHSSIDISEARAALYYQPEVELKQGLLRLWHGTYAPMEKVTA